MKRLVVLDNNAISYSYGFRNIEYSYLLKYYVDAVIYGTNRRSVFRKDLSKHIKRYPQHIDRILHINKYYDCYSVYYMLFLGNAFENLKFLKDKGHPFVFTCYPGGGFYFDPIVEDRLKQTINLKNFSMVIATQPNVYEYLKKIVPLEKIVYIYGCIHPTFYFDKNYCTKQYYKIDKETFDICFVARKQMERGIDKGYDRFIEVAHLLSKKKNIRFHVVGNYDRLDIDISGFQDRITFYGSQNVEFFPLFYAKMDLILSPNVPNVLVKGSFDGFPTGACNEAAMLGCPIFCTDELKTNQNFIDKEDLVIIPRESKDIVDIIEYYYERPESLQKISTQGRNKFLQVFDLEKQMNERIRILEKYL